MTEEQKNVIAAATGISLIVGGAIIILDQHRRYWRKMFLSQQGEHMLHNLHHHPENVK